MEPVADTSVLYRPKAQKRFFLLPAYRRQRHKKTPLRECKRQFYWRILAERIKKRDRLLYPITFLMMIV